MKHVVVYSPPRSRSYHLMSLMERRGFLNLGEYFDPLKALHAGTLDIIYRVPGVNWERRLLHSDAHSHMVNRFRHWTRRVTVYNKKSESTVSKLQPNFLSDPSLIAKLKDAGAEFVVLDRKDKWAQCVSFCLAEETQTYRSFLEKPIDSVPVSLETFWLWMQRCVTQFYGWMPIVKSSATVALDYDEVFEGNPRLDDLFGPNVREVQIHPAQNSIEKQNKIANLDQLKGWYNKAREAYPVLT